MTPGLELALVAMLCFGAGDLIYKRAASEGLKAHHFVMVQAWCFSPTVTLYAFATGRIHLDAAAWWGSLAGLFSFIGFYNFARSLRTGSVSRNAPIFRLNFMIAVVLAVLLLGEPLTLSKTIGLGFALAAVWLLLAEPAPDGSASTAAISRASLIQVLIATLGLGLSNFIYKVGLHAGATPESMLATQAWMFMPLATLVAYLTDRELKPPAATWRYGPPAALLLIFGFISLLYGLDRGPASVLVPVAQMGFVVTALLGTVLFRERLTPRKALGLAVAAASLGALAIG